MDAHRFDTMAKILATGPDSRRAVLRTLSGGVLAALLGLVGAAEVAADCQKPGQKCAKNGDCCKGAECKKGKCACKEQTSLCGNACCSPGTTCVAAKGSDVPPTCCPTTKVCGHTCCPPDRTCVCVEPPPFGPPPDPNDLCTCICPDGYEENEDGTCVCPHPCGDDCCEGEDGESCCPSGRGKRCVQTDSDRDHCGGCGKKCPPDRVCRGGECVCGPDYLDCGGTCVPKTGPGGRLGCCADADCAGAGFCCTMPPGVPTPCGTNGCAHLNVCAGCV